MQAKTPFFNPKEAEGWTTVTAKRVTKNSTAYALGFRPGDSVISVNGHEINDVLDYEFYFADNAEKICCIIGGEEKTVNVYRNGQKPFGLEFETYLMDKKRTCKNKCIFCFIDQNPKGMRESIYFKDDDERLSFLQGNYITLTNLNDELVNRIVGMHISPINVSVHTTDPALRVFMMKNKRAGEALKYLKTFSDGNISLNIQLVLCRGINDGENLRKSLRDLYELSSVQSIACVPAGLTRFREGLPQLTPWDGDGAVETIKIIDEEAKAFEKKFGSRTVYASDEFYLKAGLPVPDAEYYGDYPQLSNGVGMLRSFEDEFMSALEFSEEEKMPAPFTAVTGAAAFDLISRMVEKAKEKYKDLDGEAVCIKNEFYGESVTVAGLVVGGDIIRQLSDRGCKQRVIIPSCMLRSEGDLFLDGLSLKELETALGRKITVSTEGGDGFFDAIFSK